MFMIEPNDGHDITKELVYNVFNEDVNSRQIEIYNVFRNSRFYDGLVKAVKVYKKDQDLEKFKEEVKHQLGYAYWSKAEYEVVITSWPPYMNVEHIDGLKKEVEEHDSKWSWKQVRVNVPLDVGAKVDIYTQVLMNFDHFINYILNNLKLIKTRNKK